MFKPPSALAAEFDGIAEAERSLPFSDSLSPAERFLVERIPGDSRTLLDVGCGTGRLTRAAARRVGRAVGVDLSPGMVETARARTPARSPVEYRIADVMTDEIPGAPFDAVLAVNMVHHAPQGAVVARLARLVAPGGVLLIQDLLERRGPRYLPLNVAARVWQAIRTPGAGRALRSLYASHGRSETYLQPAEVAASYGALLPGADVSFHLLWRYSVVWRKPRAAGSTPRSR